MIDESAPPPYAASIKRTFPDFWPQWSPITPKIETYMAVIWPFCGPNGSDITAGFGRWQAAAAPPQPLTTTGLQSVSRLQVPFADGPPPITRAFNQANWDGLNGAVWAAAASVPGRPRRRPLTSFVEAGQHRSGSCPAGTRRSPPIAARLPELSHSSSPPPPSAPDSIGNT